MSLTTAGPAVKKQFVLCLALPPLHWSVLEQIKVFCQHCNKKYRKFSILLLQISDNLSLEVMYVENYSQNRKKRFEKWKQFNDIYDQNYNILPLVFVNFTIFETLFNAFVFLECWSKSMCKINAISVSRIVLFINLEIYHTKMKKKNITIYET